MKAIILTHSMYQDQEAIYPYYRLREEGTVMVAAEKVGMVRGILGVELPSNMTTATLNTSDDDYLNVFDLLVLPGGVKAMEKLRQDAYALAFIASWFGLNKPIASICSGAQMLISARVPLKGRQLAAYPAMAVDVENAGAIFLNEPVVVDGNLVSSPHYKYLAEWMRAAINLVKAKERCWKCGRIFPLSGTFECAVEGPCGAVVTAEGAFQPNFNRPWKDATG